MDPDDRTGPGEPDPSAGPAGAAEASGSEWWRAPEPSPAGEGPVPSAHPSVPHGAPGDGPPTPPPSPPAAPPPSLPGGPPEPPGPGGDAAQESAEPGPGREWWRGDDVRDELRETWQKDGGEIAAAAAEVGFQMQQAAGHISDAVAATAYPAAARRGLDIRWMRLSINIPAILLALLATWGGRTTTDRMLDLVADGGLLAPAGVLLFVVLLVGLLLLIPVGMALAHTIASLVQGLTYGLVAALRRGWHTPVVGYLLRLVAMVFVWAFGFAVLRVAGRSIVHWLTGA